MKKQENPLKKYVDEINGLDYLLKKNNNSIKKEEKKSYLKIKKDLSKLVSCLRKNNLNNLNN